MIGRIKGTVEIGSIDRREAGAGQDEPAGHSRVSDVDGNHAAIVRRRQTGRAGLVAAIGYIFKVLAPYGGDSGQRLASFIIHDPDANGAGVAGDQAAAA